MSNDFNLVLIITAMAETCISIYSCSIMNYTPQETLPRSYKC